MCSIGGPALLSTAVAALLFVPLACAAQEAPAGSPAPPTGRVAGATQPADDPAARRARDALVDGLARREPGLAPAVLDALRRVPRHLFVPGASLAEAYADHAFPIGLGQTISQPTVVAIMTDALRLSGRERVLEIGTGSGYQAAVLSLLAAQVYSIEIVAPLGEQARERLARLGYGAIALRIGDGYLGWPEAAPFDRIVLTAAPREFPAALVEQLVDGGILVAPVGPDEDQVLARWTRRGDRLDREVLGAVRFVPMVSATPER